ncbi:aminoglycoside phosphotransferase family protein [Roseobacter weihaiensis]|uniref:aminoglycoside phosphotransferase family protein n=1 Tax=Roseobacter weihaiensis TaxID=2763262 RepID=UPI001D0B5077|nr:phosphotransferase [Roseobacter sp. H9]
MSRARDANRFIAAAGWAEAQVSHLAGDASNRTYKRLRHPGGTRAVLMDAPPEKGEDVRPFVQIAKHLTALGLSAPEIYHCDPVQGFLLIEDLGDSLFTREIAADPARENPLYEAAVDVLTTLHRAPPPDVPAYDAATTAPLAALAYDWYQFGATGTVDDTAKAQFCALFHDLIAPYDGALDVLIQRDYHAENLLWLPNRTGAARVGLLDFQDAMRGHRAYDLVSVLQDARRDVPTATEQEMKTRFIAQNQLDAETFDAAYALFGLQRNLRILGVFARLCLRDRKPHYVDLLPRVWGHVQTNLKHPKLAEMAVALKADLPAPTPDLLARLKTQGGAWAGR